jgi:hypothetical protein
MNIRDEKKKYTPPTMRLVKLHQTANLMSSSKLEEDDDGVDIEELNNGYDDEFG